MEYQPWLPAHLSALALIIAPSGTVQELRFCAGTKGFVLSLLLAQLLISAMPRDQSLVEALLSLPRFVRCAQRSRAI
jgi:hypothetical protein